MSDKPPQANWLGRKIDPPGPAHWIGSAWRHFICGVLTCLLNPKITILLDAGDGVTAKSQDAKVVMSPNGWVATLDLTQVTGGGSGSIGGVNAQTANYAAVAGDAGKLVTFSSASALTLTLPSPPPSATWFIGIECVGAGGLAISRNSLNIDGAANNLALIQNQGLLIYTDGTNYFTMRGLPAYQQFKIQSDGGDYWNCKTWDGTTLGSTTIKVAKPYKLRCDTGKIASETIRGIVYTYTYSNATGEYVRTTSGSDGSGSTDYITPPPLANDIINATPFSTLAPATLAGLFWVDENTDGRNWMSA